jgi:hypothetical protein
LKYQSSPPCFEPPLDRPGVLNLILGQFSQAEPGHFWQAPKHLYRKHVQPVKQVTAERTRSDLRLEVAIGGGDHPNIGAYGPGSSDALKFSFLENPQKSNLRFGRNFPI